MAVAKDALAFVIIVAIFIIASGLGLYCYQSRKHKKQAAAPKNLFDIERQNVPALWRKPEMPLPRSKSDAGPGAKHARPHGLPLLRTQSDGATVGLARPPLAYAPRWSRPPRRARPAPLVTPAKTEDGKSLEKKAPRKSRFIEHL